jgi:predicted O-methyltransferase YrrM
MQDSTHEAIAGYLRDLYAPEDEALTYALSESAARGMPQIHIRAEEGRLLQWLIQVVGAKRVIEIGTLAGYSGTWLARGLPADGKLITLDVNPDHTAMAQEVFKRAGVADRVEARVGKGADLLAALATEGPFDAVFIDADKDSYPIYLEWAAQNLRPGGLVMAHNALSGGAVVGAKERDPGQLKGIMGLNQSLAEDPRWSGMLIAMGDGLAAGIRK